jgi:hypothetical protein
MQNKFPEAEKAIHAELALQQSIFEKNICPETVSAAACSVQRIV